MFGIFRVEEKCYVCETEIQGNDMNVLNITSREISLCTHCYDYVQDKVKILGTRELKNTMKKLVKLYGQNNIQQFTLSLAEQCVKESNDLELLIQIENEDFDFNKNVTDVKYLQLFKDEILYILKYLKRKMNSRLWINGVIYNICEQGMTITIQNGDIITAARENMNNQLVKK